MILPLRRKHPKQASRIQGVDDVLSTLADVLII